MADIGAPAGLGNSQRADQLAGQRRADERVDQPRIAGRDHVRHRDAAGEQRCEHAARDTGPVQLFADHHRVGAVAAPAADLLREVRPEQSGGACAPVQFARQLTDPFPLVDVRQDLPLGE